MELMEAGSSPGVESVQKDQDLTSGCSNTGCCKSGCYKSRCCKLRCCNSRRCKLGCCNSECCTSRCLAFKNKSENNVAQVNLEKIVSDYAWSIYLRDIGCCGRLFRSQSNYTFDIQWGYIDFKHKTILDQSKIPEYVKPEKIETELFFSEYENKTQVEQSYKFTTSRTTSNTTRFEMQKGYTLGTSLNLEVSLGEMVQIGGALSGTYSVTKTKAEEFAKTQTWNIDTEVIVPTMNKAKAKLFVYEVDSKTNFVVETTIQAKDVEGLPVTIRKVKDGKEVDTIWIDDLGCLFSDEYIERSRGMIEKREVEVLRRNRKWIETVIILKSYGVCKNALFVNQHVIVECEELLK